MAVTATPIFPQTIKNYVAQILPADTTTKKTLCTGATNGTRIDAINVASTDTSNRDIQFWMTISAVDYLLCTVQIPLNSGNTNTAPSVDILRNTQFPGLSYDSNGNRILYVANGAILKVACTGTVTAAKEIDIVCGTAGDY